MKTGHRIGRRALFWSCTTVIAVQLTTSAATLTNRYSFSDADGSTTVVDSVGGPQWDGTLPNGGIFTGSQLALAAGSQQFVQLPSGIISNYTAVTIEAWATFGTLPVNCFFFGFGNTDTNSNLGVDYIFCAPQGGRIAITDGTYSNEQGAGGAGDWSGQTLHVTAVYDPPDGYIALYTNGVLVSQNNLVTVPLSSVVCVSNFIAKSLYPADPYPDVQLDEFRIWKGALNSLEVAGSDAGGPDVVSTNAGTVTSVDLQIPFYQLVQGGRERATVIAHASLVSYPVDITRLATYSSGNTNILTVDATGQITAIGQGSTTIQAQYGAVSSTQTITVVQPAATLTHEYRFSDADGSLVAADSVGGSAWNGALPSGGTFAGGQLSLTAAGAQFVQLPEGIISNYPAVTIEAWATFPTTLPANCFFFGFGNTDVGGAGENYIYLQPSAGHIGITGFDPGWRGPEQQAGTYGNLSLQTNVHLTAVFNPSVGYIAVYKNGVLAGKNIAVTWPMNSVMSVLNYIARSLYTGDSYMDVNLDEFRIYNGTLTSQGVAISDAAGPGSIPAAVTNGPGTLLSLTIHAPATLQPLQTGNLQLLGNYANLANWDIIGNSIFPPAGLIVATSDTNVLVFGADSKLHGVNPGTSSVVVVYQGTTNTTSVTVVQAAPPVLAHRYSFTTDTSDSVGGPDWVGTLVGNASVAGGQLLLPNVTSVGPALDYLQLPAGILTNGINGIGTNFNDPAVTIETWVTVYPAQYTWANLFDFGAQNASGQAAYDIHVAVHANPNNTVIGISDSDNANVHSENWDGGSGSGLDGSTNLHVVAVFNPPAGYLAVYTNGALMGINSSITISMAGVSAVLNKIGADNWPDGGMKGSIDEFRIYNGVLSPNDVRATQVLGPAQVLESNVSLQAAVSGGNIVLSWPVAGGAFSLQSKASLGSGSWTTIATPVAQLVGTQWQVTIPNTGGAKFFRLAR